MVDNVGGNQPTIKLKGTGKSIDLNKLEGMRKTQGNASIFEKGKFDINGDGKIDENDIIDKNGDGIINEDEVGVLQGFLKKLGGRDNKTTAKDFHSGDKATNEAGFKALQSFADQQAATGIYKESGDGYSYEFNKDTDISTEIITDANGITTTTEDLGGGVKKITVSGKKEIGPKEFDYPKDMDTTTEEVYNSAEAKEAGKPDQKTYKYSDGTSVTVNYTYGEDGTITATKTDAEGKTQTVQYKLDDNGEITDLKPVLNNDGKVEGEESVQEQPQVENPEEQPVQEQPAQNYEVKKGDSLWKIAKNTLGDGATATEIANYVDKLIEENNLQDKVSHKNGMMYVLIHVGDNLKLPATGTETPVQPDPTPKPEVPETPVQPDPISKPEVPVTSGQPDPISKPEVPVTSGQPDPISKPEVPTSYDLKNDTVYQSAQARLNKLGAQRQQIINQFGGNENMSYMELLEIVTLKLMGTDTWIEESGRISDTLKQYDDLKRNIENYQEKMNNWQDGATIKMITGTLGQGTCITLTNGQRAVKFASGVYPLGLDGYPDVNAKITDESLIPQ